MHRIKSVVALSATSAGGAVMSFFVATLPVVQWFAAVLAAVSAVIAIILGVLKLIKWMSDK